MNCVRGKVLYWKHERERDLGVGERREAKRAEGRERIHTHKKKEVLQRKGNGRQKKRNKKGKKSIKKNPENGEEKNKRRTFM